MTYSGNIGSRKYTFNTIDDYLLGLEIMEDLQEVFEERMGYCNTTFEFSDNPKLENYHENS